ncbi:MAG: glycosyltransferase family 2 protein [Pseudomonadota bacterium]
MNKHPGLSVVMVAYNEAENILPVAEETLLKLRLEKFPYELIFVDDGSTDQTLARMRDLLARYPENVRLFKHEKNGGIGRAVRSGYRAARLDWVTFLPADGQVSVKETLRLAKKMPGNDLVISSYRQRQDVDSQFRMVLSKGLRLLTRLATGVADHLGSIYVFNRALLNEFPLRSNSFFVNLELPLRIIMAGRPYEHKTIEVQARRSGKSKVVKWQVISEVAIELGKFRLSLWEEQNQPAIPFLQMPQEWPVREIFTEG